MAVPAKKVESEKSKYELKRLAAREQLAQPQIIVEEMVSFMRDGDVSSITDLIGAYVSLSPKYKSQEQFAEAIGTTRQTFHRMIAHSDTVSMRVFFRAVEQIHEDAREQAKQKTKRK